jgi:hypothetical protein
MYDDMLVAVILKNRDKKSLSKIIELESTYEQKFFQTEHSNAVLSFLKQYLEKYELNDLGQLKEVFVSKNIYYPEHFENYSVIFDYLIDELLQRFRFKLFHRTINKWMESVSVYNSEYALKELLSTSRKALQIQWSNNTKVADGEEVSNEVILKYEIAKSGVKGIPSRWQTINDATNGWQQDDLVLFVSRPGVGKTTALILNLIEALEKTKGKALWINTEMSKAVIVGRMLAIMSKIDYNSIRKGQLGEFAEGKFKEMVAKYAQEYKHRLYMTKNSFQVTIPEIDSLLEEIEPSICFIDSYNLVKPINKNIKRESRSAEVLDELTDLKIKHGIPIIVSGQFNREVGRYDVDADLGNLSQTDVAGFNCSYVYAFLQSKEMEKDGYMRIKTLKARDSGYIKDFVSVWRYKTGEFYEVNKDVFSKTDKVDF